ncbi:MAG TPA: glycoside hydrolase family 32 protein, partial [Chthoniobacteraceae bacterium]|nr:glycoside hydrolase family 32 protein [Chthoniobacteraceae bacterium]
GTLPGQMHVDGFVGKQLANSFVGGDDSIGKLTSPEFTMTHEFISFRIGGGGWEGTTCMNLIVDGVIVRTASGPNTEPGGKETLAAQGWDVREWKGKSARLEIIDNAKGGWGHINVDHVALTDTKPPLAAKVLKDVSREWRIEKRWLNFPVKSRARVRRLTLTIDGKVERRFEAELADSDPDWLAPFDVSAWRGQKIVISVDRLPEESRALEQITQSDEFPGGETLYREPLRPQIHFSARRGWLNDPNGLTFFKGEYHLFFQHSPFSWNGTLKHWGHAVSRDLVHWTELGDVIDPDELGSIWSGSGVVDWKNSSGLGTADQPPLVLFYTAAGPMFTQCLASSIDGRRITKFAGNPILAQVTHGNRDPKVIWHEGTQRWVMALYVGHEPPANPSGTNKKRRDTIQFFTSADLKRWSYASESEGYYECPDIFELPVDGNPQKRKWVLTAANTNYQIGTFDGKVFRPETEILPGQRGNGMYAPQTFSDAPDGRRLQIGWGTAAAPGMPFNQMMTFPCQLTLRSTSAGPRLCWQPVMEIQSLRVKTHAFAQQSIAPGNNPLEGVAGELIDLRAEFAPGNATGVAFQIHGREVVYDAQKQELICGNKRAALPMIEGRIRLEIIADRLSLEIFGNDGIVYMPMSITPQAGTAPALVMSAAGGTATIRALEVHELRSIWEQP